MRIIFFCASEFGLNCIDALEENFELCGVVTLKPKCKLSYYDIKEKKRKVKTIDNKISDRLQKYCKLKQIDLLETNDVNGQIIIDFINQLQADIIIVAGWYHIVKKNIIQSVRLGVIGLHSSLLPKYRGGAPLVWQIINGEEFAGVTLFYFNDIVDGGDIIGQKKVAITENDTIKTVYNKIEKQSIVLLQTYLPQIENNTVVRKPQINLSDDDIWPQRTAEDGEINWNQSVKDIKNFIRAQTKPYPGAWTIINGKKITIWDCDVELIDC